MRSRSITVRAAALTATAALALALPAGAIAANALGGVTTPTTTTAPATTPVTPATVPPTTTTSGGGLTPAEEIGIAVAAVGLLGAIAYVIRSDARISAGQGRVVDIDRERATVRPRAERVKQSRARAKAARRARRSGR